MRTNNIADRVKVSEVRLTKLIKLQKHIGAYSNTHKILSNILMVKKFYAEHGAVTIVEIDDES